MNVRTLCLAILSRGDATGYEIRKESIEGEFSHFVDASFGSIYPALARLESEGLVTWREETQPGKPARKIYSITDAGRADFVASLCEAPKPDLFRSEFLLIAVFAELAGEEAVARAIEIRTTQLEEERELLERIRRGCGQASVDWVTSYGISCKSQSIDFLANNKDRLLAIAAGRTDDDAGAVEGPAQAAE